MNKLKRILPLAMAGAMLVSPVSMSAQAKVIDNNTEENAVVAVTASSYSYSSPAYIRGSNVAFRRSPGLSGTVIMYFQNNTSIHVDKNNQVKVDGISWYPCKYGNTYGYVAAQYVYVIPT